jgi:flavin reductase (DIM6/NTAB) family NADH-FMN oxidoreductase RutF
MTPTPLDLLMMRSQSFAVNLLAAEIIHQTVDELLAAEHFAEDFLEHGDSFIGRLSEIQEVTDAVEAHQLVLNRVALMFENMGICA